MHYLQERIAKAHGSQCGFCTPGFVMSMYSLMRNSCTPSEEEIEEAFQGNLFALDSLAGSVHLLIRTVIQGICVDVRAIDQFSMATRHLLAN